MDRKTNYYELSFNVALLIIAVYVVIQSFEIGFGTLAKPKAGFFPLCGGLLILISGIAIMLQKFRDSEPPFKNTYQIKMFFTILIIYVLWVITMPYLGYILVTFLAAIGMFKRLGLEGWLKPLILAIAICIFIYVLFDIWLYTDLPRGILSR